MSAGDPAAVGVELDWLGSGDVDRMVAASGLFDRPVTVEWARRFVDQPDHHLCLAHASDTPAGFVSGVEVTHPDKGTEMFLYELGVDEAFRGRGVGVRLVTALADLARERGCTGMWVLTDADNAAAIATYRRAGASEPSAHVMLEWEL